MTLFPKTQSILPTSWRQDRPLFLVMAILAFLACLSALSVRTTYRAAGTWGDDLRNAATIQIKVQLDQDGKALSEDVAQYMLSRPEVRLARPLSEGRARDLLRPWLGDVPLPDGLPVPMLVEVVLNNGAQLDTEAIQADFQAMGVIALIDDHSRWSRDISRAAAAAQTVAISALLLLVLASVAAAGFATEAGLAARQNIVRVLSQVGATPKYIARLFTGRFLMLGIKAGTLGALLAAAAAGLFWYATHQGRGLNTFIPSLRLEQADIFILILCPFLTGLVCAVSARFTVLRSLKAGAAS